MTLSKTGLFLTLSIVEIESSVQNTWSHSNNENGIIRATTTAKLPASLYLNNAPGF